MSLTQTSSMKRTAIVAAFELRRSFTGPFGLLAAALFVVFHTWTIRTSLQVQAAGADRNMDGFGAGVLGWLTGLDASTVTTVFSNHPPMMMVFFLLALFGTPILVVLAACDQLSSDVGSHHVRFLLVRTSRGPLFAGKALGTLGFVAILQILATAAAVIAALVGGVPAVEAALFGLRILVTLIFFSIPFVALMALAGTVLPHPALGMACALGLQFLLWMMSSLGSLASPGLARVRFAYPTAMRFQLVSDSARDVLPALGHMTLLTLVFAIAGIVIFRWRDL